MSTKPLNAGMFRCVSLSLLVGTVLNLLGCAAQRVEPRWGPAPGRLMTRWAKEVSPDNAHREYPRPQMVRESWLNLNGLWAYAIRPKDQPPPTDFDGQILVPFAVESALSAVMKQVGEENLLWYRRTFEIPSEWAGQRVLLHFGAVDWDARVWINGREVGAHRGGYDAFSFDITDALTDGGTQQIVVSVWDPTDAGYQPNGKQVRKPRGIWYTPTTGIWQTVWLEPVKQAYIERLKIVPDVDAQNVRVTALCSKGSAGTVEVAVKERGSLFVKGEAVGEAGRQIVVPVKRPRLWSPRSPYLYDLKVTLKDSDGKTVDTVKSYFGMRKISVAKDEAGINRLLLNNKPLFQYGPLDQGFWPDGLYTAPTDEALRYDIEVLKRLGCNMLRKHVKIEPDRLYYWCDKLGLLVWQDMPSADKDSREDSIDKKRTEESKRQFEIELNRMVDGLGNHPSIIMWVLFNEGWGQYDTHRLTKWLKNYDPTRLANNASGWKDRRAGDIRDVHKYPGPEAPKNEPDRAVVLGEFGGLGLPVKGHTWQDEENWGYRKFNTHQELTEAYLDLLEKLRPLIKGGLAAAVYTQTTDVEIEVNGLMTYDREMIKMDAKKITAANKELYRSMD